MDWGVFLHELKRGQLVTKIVFIQLKYRILNTERQLD